MMGYKYPKIQEEKSVYITWISIREIIDLLKEFPSDAQLEDRGYDSPDFYVVWQREMNEDEKAEQRKKWKKEKEARDKRKAEKEKDEKEQLKKLAAKYPEVLT